MFLLMQVFINCFKRRQMYFGLMFYDIISLLYVHVEAYSMYVGKSISELQIQVRPKFLN